MDSVYFNAQHSPIGAFASFTLGYPGARGGLGLELGRPANQSVFIGLESHEKGVFDALPFFKEAEDEARRYDVEAPEDHQPVADAVMRPFARDAVHRRLDLATDTWTAGDLTFRIFSPVRTVPDPGFAKAEQVKQAICPAVLVEMEVDNTAGSAPRRAFFGYQGNDPCSAMRRLDDRGEGAIRGVGQGRITAIATDDASLESGMAFTIEQVVAPKIPENRVFGLGGVGALVGTVEAGQRRTFRFAVCFYRGGIVTSGEPAAYYYTHYFSRIEEVAAHAMASFDTYRQWALEADAMLEQSTLSDDQKFMLAHAVHSYYGSTQFLQWVGEGRDGRPYWVVNEGEYRMMNTFDLTADQLFFEMKMNPWTVRNELDTFIDRYSYRDQVRFPGDQTLHPGGISFTHDQGIANHISRAGYSTYELFGLSGCFSHMTHEQLVNFVLCAAVYIHGNEDEGWLRVNRQVVADCLESLVNRDHPEPAKRNGIMGLDSSRTMGGAEITTYDSLDESLGQARNNLYMAVKTWAAYVALEKLMHMLGADLADLAGSQAVRAADTLLRAMTPEGFIPGVMFEGNDSKIIPAIEGLVFPPLTGCPGAVKPDGRFGKMLDALKRHIDTVLRKGTCLFDDDGWKLSSTSNNSWLSKIYLSQHVYRHVLGLPWNEAGKAADAAHVRWLLEPEKSAYWAWSDQMISGQAWGSKYYPRGVTAILWLDE